MAPRFFHLVNGEQVDSQTTFLSRNASNHEDILGEFPAASKEQVRLACQVAKQAWTRWHIQPAPLRGELVGHLGEILTREKEALSQLLTREIGKPLPEARGDVQEAIDTCHFFQSEGRRPNGQTIPSEMPAKDLLTYRRSLGVVGIITAGNFPIAVPSWKIIPALLTGNTLVWKPSEDCPLTSYAFARLIEEAGFPAGVVNVVFGSGAGEAGQFLVEMMDEGLLDKIAFTGSTTVGREIGAIAGRNLLHPTLELGGKNPLVIMRDANLESAVDGALWASFGTAGQRCTSAGNILLDAPVYDQFKTRFLEAVQQLRIGDPLLYPDVFYGPFINERFFSTWQQHYSWGKDDGATLLYGSGRITSANRPAGFLGDPATGYYGWPTIWEDVRPGMKIFQQEIFGPTINLVRVQGIEEAIRIANSVSYGLSSAIYTNDRDWAYQFRERIQAGMTSINNSTTGAEAHMPFGGIKGSGNGSRESGIWVLEHYTYWQAVNDDLSGKLQRAQIDTSYVGQHTPFHVETLSAVSDR
jgi:aldehyde dehydrogenase (NAD+)